MSNLYRILGVSRFANRAEIRQAYWSLTRRIREEQRPVGERLAQIEQAFHVLDDSERRRTYDSSAAREGRTVAGRVDDVPVSEEAAPRFPSMLTVAPRMLTAFFGTSAEHCVMHTTRVELSPRQALEGTRIPVDLPVRPTCPACGGRGETWSEPCGVCVGTGSGLLSHQLKLRVPPGVRHGMRLRFSVTPPYAPETHVELRIAVR